MIRAGRPHRRGCFRRRGFRGVAALLNELRAKLGIGIFVFHFHHQLRGAEADEDERFVKALAEEFISNLFPAAPTLRQRRGATAGIWRMPRAACATSFLLRCASLRV